MVADTGNGRLVVLDAAGKWLANWGKGLLTSPTGLGRLPDGRVAVADPGAGKLVLFDGTGASVAPPPITGLVAPADVAVDGLGRWYVVDRKPGLLLRFDGRGQAAGSVGVSNPPDDGFEYFLRPQGVAVAADGRVFVADTANKRVQVFDADLKYLTTLGGATGPGSGGLREPRGLSVAADGRLYVADTYHHRIQVFEPATADWLPAITNGFGTRTTQAVTAVLEWSGQLYAGTQDDTVGAGLRHWGGTGQWQPVPLGGVAGAGQTAIAVLASHGNMLYAGTESRMITTSRSAASSAPRPTAASCGAAATARAGRRWPRPVSAWPRMPPSAPLLATTASSTPARAAWRPRATGVPNRRCGVRPPATVAAGDRSGSRRSTAASGRRTGPSAPWAPSATRCSLAPVPTTAPRSGPARTARPGGPRVIRTIRMIPRPQYRRWVAVRRLPHQLR